MFYHVSTDWEKGRKKLFTVDRMEIEANKFAMQLLISDDDVREYAIEQQYTVDMLSRLWGYKKELVILRLGYLQRR